MDELAVRRYQTLIDRQRNIAAKAVDKAKEEWKRLAQLEQNRPPSYDERPYT